MSTSYPGPTFTASQSAPPLTALSSWSGGHPAAQGPGHPAVRSATPPAVRPKRRQRPRPTGGRRYALAYAVAGIVAFVFAAGWALALLATDQCDQEGFGCLGDFLYAMGFTILATIISSAVMTGVFRLGWVFWVALVGFALPIWTVFATVAERIADLELPVGPVVESLGIGLATVLPGIIGLTALAAWWSSPLPAEPHRATLARVLRAATAVAAAAVAVVVQL